MIFKAIRQICGREIDRRPLSSRMQMQPLAQELRTNVLGLFSSFLDLGKTGGMEKD